MQQPIPALSGTFLVPLATAVALCLATPASAQSAPPPIKIGVIAEVQAVAGQATPGGAQIAADEINAKGGILGRCGFRSKPAGDSNLKSATIPS